MLTKRDLEDLHQFQSKKYPVFSLYLDTNGKNNSKKQIETKFKEIVRTARLKINSSEDRDYRRMCNEEIQKIEEYITNNIQGFAARGLALFSCSGEDMWRTIELSRPPRDRLFIGDGPHIRPLQFQHDEYYSFGIVLLNKNKARIYKIYQGSVLEYDYITDDVPSRIKRAGWAGYDEKKKARKQNAKISEHLHKVADAVFELFKKEHFEWLILCGRQKYINEFETNLHSYLKEKIVSMEELQIDIPEHQLLEHVMKIEKKLNFTSQFNLVKHLGQELKSGGLAVSGLEDVLKHLNAQAISTLIVSRDYHIEGVRCTRCAFLGILEKECTLCGSKTIDIPDVITDAIDRALDLNADVKQVYEGVGMDEFGHIGAFVHFLI